MSMQFNSVVRMIDPTRNTSKSPTTSENPSTVGLPTRHHQRHANRLQATRNPGVMRDGVGTEPSSDADSDLFGLDWRDDPIATINSVTERNDRTRGGHIR